LLSIHWFSQIIKLQWLKIRQNSVFGLPSDRNSDKKDKDNLINASKLLCSSKKYAHNDWVKGKPLTKNRINRDKIWVLDYKGSLTISNVGIHEDFDDDLLFDVLELLANEKWSIYMSIHLESIQW
jgi:hypothetical protein